MTEHRLLTKRMILVAATPKLARAEALDRDELAALLGATIHPSWPPAENDESARMFFWNYLTDHPDAVGFMGWSWLLREPEPSAKPVLIGGGGFKGLPSQDGTVEVGYSIVEEHYGKGLATEGVRALVDWAFGDPRVHRVIGETRVDLTASQRVLEKCGFAPAPERAEATGAIHFELRRKGGSTGGR